MAKKCPSILSGRSWGLCKPVLTSTLQTQTLFDDLGSRYHKAFLVNLLKQITFKRTYMEMSTLKAQKFFSNVHIDSYQRAKF